jgi:hypothetical protein
MTLTAPTRFMHWQISSSSQRRDGSLCYGRLSTWMSDQTWTFDVILQQKKA